MSWARRRKTAALLLVPRLACRVGPRRVGERFSSVDRASPTVIVVGVMKCSPSRWERSQRYHARGMSSDWRVPVLTYLALRSSGP